MGNPKGSKLLKTVEKERSFALAYIECGFKGKEAGLKIGLPAKSVVAEASTLLSSPNVQAFLQEELEKIRSRARFGIAEVVEEFRRNAFSNIENFTRLDGDQRVLDMSAATSEQLASIQSLETIETFKITDDEEKFMTRRTKLRLHSKNDALDKLLKYFGGYNGKGGGEGSNDTHYHVHMNMGSPQGKANEDRSYRDGPILEHRPKS